MKTRQEILEIQAQEYYNLKLDKHKARLVGFALETEIESYNKTLKELQNELEDIENGKTQATENNIELIKELIKNFYNSITKLEDIKTELKYYYGILED